MREKAKRSLDNLRKMAHGRAVYYGKTDDSWTTIRLTNSNDSIKRAKAWCADNAKGFYAILGINLRFKDEKDAFRFVLALGDIVDESPRK